MLGCGGRCGKCVGVAEGGDAEKCGERCEGSEKCGGDMRKCVGVWGMCGKWVGMWVEVGNDVGEVRGDGV